MSREIEDVQIWYQNFPSEKSQSPRQQPDWFEPEAPNTMERFRSVLQGQMFRKSPAKCFLLKKMIAFTNLILSKKLLLLNKFSKLNLNLNTILIILSI
jgi:hypothetical protein